MSRVTQLSMPPSVLIESECLIQKCLESRDVWQMATGGVLFFTQGNLPPPEGISTLG